MARRLIIRLYELFSVFFDIYLGDVYLLQGKKRVYIKVRD